MTMNKKLLTVLCGIAVLWSVGAAEKEGFRPCLEKVTVNGTVLYPAAAKFAGPITVDGSWPTQIEYVFVNKGNTAADRQWSVFVHFMSDQKVLRGADFMPDDPPSTAWEPEKRIKVVKSLLLSDYKGKTLEVFVGLYDRSDKKLARFPLANPGIGADNRLRIGALKID